MSWLGDCILPRHETLSRIYAAYRERYNYYSACGLAQSEIGALLPPPEYPLIPENMKSWMRLFADAVGRLLRCSLDLKKLGEHWVYGAFDSSLPEIGICRKIPNVSAF